MVARAFLTNRPMQIAIAVILVLAVVYFMGRKAGQQAEKQSFWQRLFGTGPDEAVNIQDVTVNGQTPADNVQSITDAIWQALEGRTPLLNGNGDAINSAFALFNNLPATGKASTINDWNTRYLGTDKPYWGTGNYGTLRQEIAAFANEGLQPEVAIAYRWMQDNKIQ